MNADRVNYWKPTINEFCIEHSIWKSCIIEYANNPHGLLLFLCTIRLNHFSLRFAFHLYWHLDWHTFDGQKFSSIMQYRSGSVGIARVFILKCCHYLEHKPEHKHLQWNCDSVTINRCFFHPIVTPFGWVASSAATKTITCFNDCYGVSCNCRLLSNEWKKKRHFIHLVCW